ncbi:DNA-directed RNA polymerase subunit beta-like subunit, conserved in apicomplexa (apicoplast) [Babesia microti strain RI]|uniref:DNA-directed RNA polymerase subunit beta-like subunit, conserved in apicomplexa n=1 Tax=Babesia microti (strain RI) TaxID=1133968 RepID=A0A068W935_BABMR|nr:DNA-directed RNA polymerase subunit beta-like subunit, conserved in apicomplexa [Babesia microti strain RI]CDR32615.1 DNA-directed RNA polymerase subunit beta-like subunit, conserved in apicomplexa [Babesia microti strain RI]|eukprot:YP_009363184.1 DNA-directed RNA polymerase subunit beta-like subunit, conserved in apicomplexa (apicoplast) [Babesia microti strain RI]
MNYINYKNIIINKLIKNLTIYKKNLKIYKFNNFYKKKTPLEFINYLYKNYIKKNKINNKIINKNIIKKIDRDDFDILLDFANIKIKNTIKPIYGLLLNTNTQQYIYKILYYFNKKIIKFININTTIINIYNIYSLYIGNYKNIFIFINEIYNILKNKSLNKYLSSKYSLLIIYNSIIFSILYINNINKLNYSLSNIIIIAKKISNFIQIIKCNNIESTIIKNNIFSLYDINIINNSFIKYKLNECDYCPIPLSISLYTKKKENSNILKFNSSINNTLNFLNLIYTKEKIDWSIDSKINIIFSNLIPIGSGWYRLFYNS